MMNINAVLDPTTGFLLELRQQLKTPEAKVQRDGVFNKLSRLSQGSNTRTIKGTNTINFITLNQKPTNKKATYPRIVVIYRPQKQDPYQVRITIECEKSTMQVKPSRQILTLPQLNVSSIVLSAPNFLSS